MTFKKKKKKIPFHNVSRQKIIECLRNEFNWKLKSNKAYKWHWRYGSIKLFAKRSEVDFKRKDEIQAEIRKVFIFRLSSSSLSLLFPQVLNSFWGKYSCGRELFLNSTQKFLFSYPLQMTDWLKEIFSVPFIIYMRLRQTSNV